MVLLPIDCFKSVFYNTKLDKVVVLIGSEQVVVDDKKELGIDPYK